MKVAKWISYKESEGMPVVISTMGGFFNWNEKGMRWKDYIADWTEQAIPYLEALKAEIAANHLRLTGHEHQYSNAGVPVFEDGNVATFSYRAWGDLMAAVWSEEEDKDYSYMDFYM